MERFGVHGHHRPAQRRCRCRPPAGSAQLPAVHASVMVASSVSGCGPLLSPRLASHRSFPAPRRNLMAIPLRQALARALRAESGRPRARDGKPRGLPSASTTKKRDRLRTRDRVPTHVVLMISMTTGPFGFTMLGQGQGPASSRPNSGASRPRALRRGSGSPGPRGYGPGHGRRRRAGSPGRSLDPMSFERFADALVALNWNGACRAMDMLTEATPGAGDDHGAGGLGFGLIG